MTDLSQSNCGNRGPNDPDGHFACSLPDGHDGLHRHGNFAWGTVTERKPPPDGVSVFVCIVCGRANYINLGHPVSYNHCRFTGCPSHFDDELQPLVTVPYVLGGVSRVLATARAVDQFFDCWEWDDGDPPDCIGDLRQAIQEIDDEAANRDA